MRADTPVEELRQGLRRLITGEISPMSFVIATAVLIAQLLCLAE